MYFSSSTSMIRISLPKFNYKSCSISASIHAKDFQFKGNNILHIQLRIFIGAIRSVQSGRRKPKTKKRFCFST